jgi:nucleoredoxin
MLKEFYQKRKQQQTGSEDYEIVFCSMDRTAEEYKGYAGEMPWYCLPHQSPAMGPLASRYEAQGIPHLVAVDTDGSLLTLDGVGELSARAEDFPWRPQPITDLLPSFYLDSSKEAVSMSELDGKYLMLYFSAHWCPPCQRFTPVLSKAYTALKQQRQDFEVRFFSHMRTADSNLIKSNFSFFLCYRLKLLFVSSDRDQAGFDEYWGSMTFGAIPFNERQAKAALSARLGVRGIPALIMLSPEREVISDNVRDVIQSGDYISDFPYYPKMYGDLNSAGNAINQQRCVVVFHEAGDDSEQDDIREALQTAAGNNKDDKSLRFYWATSSGGLVTILRDTLKLGTPSEEPVLALVDVPNGGAYYISSQTDVTAETIQEFLRNPGEKKSL